MKSIKEMFEKYHETYVEKHKDVKCICVGDVLWSNCQKCEGLYLDHIKDCPTFVWGWTYACNEKDGIFDPYS